VLYVDWNYGTKVNKFKYYETPAGLVTIYIWQRKTHRNTRPKSDKVLWNTPILNP